MTNLEPEDMCVHGHRRVEVCEVCDTEEFKRQVMKVSELKALIADLPDDMPVVVRTWCSRAKSIVGVHVRSYDARYRRIAEPEDDNPFTRVLVLNPHD